jgi:RNA polymerase sigma-70 factor (ECF subfamily)
MSEAEFVEWVAPHMPAMANLAARLVGHGDRDDVVQEALIRAWRRRTTFNPVRGSARAWLLAIVADQVRRRRRRWRALAALATGVATGPEAEGDLELRDAIARLSPRQRVAVELHYYVDLPVAEVAQAMGCAEGTVKATAAQVRARLREALEETR